MDYITKFVNGMFDKGGLVAVGGVCAYFFKNDHLPSFMGPVSYGMIAAGALGVIRYVVIDYEKDKCDELILDLEEVNSALENKHRESEKIKNLAEFIAEKRDLLQGWRQDSARLGDKVKVVKLKCLQRQPSNFLIRGRDLGEQSKDSRDVCAAVSISGTEDNFGESVNKESSDMTDHARDTKDLYNLTLNVDTENRDENEINLARSDASTGSYDSQESKELEEEAEKILSDMESRLKVIAKPRGRNVAKFYESIALKLFERVEEQNQRKLIEEQEDAKTLKGKMMTKQENFESKKQPILEAIVRTDAISKSEKHEIKHKVEEEKPKERKDSHGKTSRIESTGVIPEGIALRLFEMEKQKQRKMKEEQEDAKTLKGKMLTKEENVEIYEKKQPRWEATAETGAIRKSEKKHVMKLNVKKEEKKHEMKQIFRKEKHRERKDSHGKTSRKENTEKIQLDFLNRENMKEKLEKVHQLHKCLRDIPVIKIDLEEITPEEIVKDYEEKNALLKDLCKELGEEKLNEENKRELTETTQDYQESKQCHRNPHELLQENTNIKDVTETIQTEHTEGTSSESVKNSEKIVDEKNEKLRDFKNVKKDEAVEKDLSCEQGQKQTENQSTETSVRHQVEKDQSCEQGEKQQTEKQSIESSVRHVEKDPSLEQEEKQRTENQSTEPSVRHQVEKDQSCEQGEKQQTEKQSIESPLRHQVEGLSCEQEEKQQTEHQSIESSACQQVEKDLSCEQEEKKLTENLSIEPSLLNQ